jgi:hypothetical protein
MSKETDKIAQDIDSTRDRVVSNLDELIDRTSPEYVAKTQLERVKNFYLDEFGGVRVDRAAKTAGVVFGLAILRKLFK